MCEKHKQRKRKDCPDCFPEEKTNDNSSKRNKSPEVKPVTSIKKVDSQPKIFEGVSKADIAEVVAKAEETISKVTKVESIKSSKFDEKEYIQAVVERELRNTISKLRAELSDLKNIQWEHLHIPLGTFSLDLMLRLEQDGWKYCQMINEPQKMMYSEPGPFVIVQRVVRDKMPPKPDFNKKGWLQRYLNKE